MKVLKLVSVLVLVILISGCGARHKKSTPEGRTFMDIYSSGYTEGRKEVKDFIEGLELRDTYGYTKPYVPVRKAPDVRQVWIPTHKAEDGSDSLVAGHWVYVVVRDSKWFIEDQDQTKVKIPVLIPYKEGKVK